MRKGIRLLLATAAGIAAFATGTTPALATQAGVATAACALTATDVTGITFDDAYVPLKGHATVGFEATVRNPYVTGGDGRLGRQVTGLRAQFQKAGETTWYGASIGQIPGPPAGTPAAPADIKVRGGFRVAKGDRDGTWRVRLLITRGVQTHGSCAEVAVAPRLTYIDASVTDPIVLVPGKETEVNIRANVIGASSVTAHLLSEDADDSVDVKLSESETAGRWQRKTWFGDDYAKGAWTLELTVTRGKESARFGRADRFWVGTGSKARAKVSFDVSAHRVREGRKIRLYGRAYRNGSAYSGKKVGLYYKKKGSSSWRFAYSVQANRSGRFGKTVQPRHDAYWRAQTSGTGKTAKARSGYEFVDVR
ncbi:hypothetical protein OHA77_12675 [Streptosporangium sp. NBC_01639]|uniref:hypothetical protein n=1 Tax=Streptosporangium sp. NBC_01639 TaxID=2975948 RepID=UPI00386ECAFB|nr:hypothetical protein OHA77_12675 [Streptosporangium sp. NBC_01639]